VSEEPTADSGPRPGDPPNARFIIIEDDDGIATITINRPEKRNALDTATRAELIAAFDWAHSCKRVRVVVLTAAGNKAFASGADLSEGAEPTPAELAESLRERRVYDAVEQCAKPVVAMIKGACVGGGCELAMAADVRIASDQARFGQPEIRLGMIPGGGATQRLPRLVGRGHAMRLILTGDLIDADEAERLGLVDIVVPLDSLEDRTRQLCASMSRNSSLALQLAKEAIRAAAELPLSAGLVAEHDLFCRSYASEDRVEGVNAFMEKREPRFTGR